MAEYSHQSAGGGAAVHIRLKPPVLIAKILAFLIWVMLPSIRGWF
jgi:hypothetical protein